MGGGDQGRGRGGGTWASRLVEPPFRQWRFVEALFGQWLGTCYRRARVNKLRIRGSGTTRTVVSVMLMRRHFVNGRVPSLSVFLTFSEGRRCKFFFFFLRGTSFILTASKLAFSFTPSLHDIDL